MKRTLIQSVFALTGAVAVGACFIGRAEAANLGGDELQGNLIGTINSNINDESTLEAGYNFDVADTGTDISQVFWSGTKATDSFLVRLFRPQDSMPFASLTGNISSFVKSVQAYDEPTTVDLSFYTLSLDSPFRLDSGEYVLSIQNNSDWGWTRINRGTTLFRFDATDPWEYGVMSSGALDIGFTRNTMPHPTQTVPTPALLPGLIGIGVTALRNRRRKETATQA